METQTKFSAEARERAVRLALEQQHGLQWPAMEFIAAKIGCTAETLRKCVRRAERGSGQRAGLTSSELERLKALEQENRELRFNEILRKAAAFFAQAELDRRGK